MQSNCRGPGFFSTVNWITSWLAVTEMLHSAHTGQVRYVTIGQGTCTIKGKRKKSVETDQPWKLVVGRTIYPRYARPYRSASRRGRQFRPATILKSPTPSLWSSLWVPTVLRHISLESLTAFQFQIFMNLFILFYFNPPRLNRNNSLLVCYLLLCAFSVEV